MPAPCTLRDSRFEGCQRRVLPRHSGTFDMSVKPQGWGTRGQPEGSSEAAQCYTWVFNTWSLGRQEIIVFFVLYMFHNLFSKKLSTLGAQVVPTGHTTSTTSCWPSSHEKPKSGTAPPRRSRASSAGLVAPNLEVSQKSRRSRNREVRPFLRELQINTPGAKLWDDLMSCLTGRSMKLDPAWK
jgi:hypothetical protein